MKAFFVMVFFSVAAFSCSQRTEEGNLLIAKKEMQVILDSFVQKHAEDNYSVYELYINKFEPDQTNMILYAGDVSLTNKIEAERYDQYPVAYTISQGVKIYIYSGVERYFTNTAKRDEIPLVELRNDRGTRLAIIDSCGVIHTYEIWGGYPFVPLPLDIEFPDIVPSELIELK